MRTVIDALLPSGSIWNPKTDGDLDRLLDGIGVNAETLRQYIMGMADIRNPYLTRILSELEQELGIVPDESVDESIRRQWLAAVMFAKDSDGSLSYLQNVLTAAGFDVLIHSNDSGADPDDIIQQSGNCIMGNTTAVCGNDSAFHGQISGQLLVNGPLYVNQTLVTYATPPAEYWKLVFFVGGLAVTDLSGNLLGVTFAGVPASRKAEFIRLIIRFKPMFTWVGLNINYV